ncbi:MAG: hypothetical protein AB1728_02735 [Bacteroidota bacterium]
MKARWDFPPEADAPLAQGVCKNAEKSTPRLATLDTPLSAAAVNAAEGK